MIIQNKTNALRILEAAEIKHIALEYDVSDGKIDGLSVARKVNKEPERVFKTLVTTGKATGVNVFVIPVEFELNLKKAALAVNDKYIEMIKSRELEPLTGYIHGGCSPIGMKKQYPTYIEETAMLYQSIVVSAGRIGVQVEIGPEDLAKVTVAEFRDLV